MQRIQKLNVHALQEDGRKNCNCQSLNLESCTIHMTPTREGRPRNDTLLSQNCPSIQRMKAAAASRLCLLESQRDSLLRLDGNNGIIGSNY